MLALSRWVTHQWWFNSNSEAFASELLVNLEDMFPPYKFRVYGIYHKNPKFRRVNYSLKRNMGC